MESDAHRKEEFQIKRVALFLCRDSLMKNTVFFLFSSTGDNQMFVNQLLLFALLEGQVKERGKGERKRPADRDDDVDVDGDDAWQSWLEGEKMDVRGKNSTLQNMDNLSITVSLQLNGHRQMEATTYKHTAD